VNWFTDRGIVRTEPEYVIQIPDVRQQDDFDCGAAVVRAVLRLYDKRPPHAVDALANPVQGLAPDTVEAVFRAAGLPVLAGNLTLDDLRHFTRLGRPVVCPTAIDGGHWVAVAGVGRSRVHYHDPLRGPRSMAFPQWLESWRGSTRYGHHYDAFGIVVG
jgi:ABC-type bacteriocin/lantibiotic exporter with double-glycine peptidase domain